eukprot:1144353-Pelagomonas_calceolata.AAC.2
MLKAPEYKQHSVFKGTSIAIKNFAHASLAAKSQTITGSCSDTGTTVQQHPIWGTIAARHKTWQQLQAAQQQHKKILKVSNLVSYKGLVYSLGILKEKL